MVLIAEKLTEYSPRGEKYVISELTAPTRTVTSTVFTSNGDAVSVKTKTPIPKDKIFECMKIIGNAVADENVKIGDVVVENVFGSDIVATSNAK